MHGFLRQSLVIVQWEPHMLSCCQRGAARMKNLICCNAAAAGGVQRALLPRWAPSLASASPQGQRGLAGSALRQGGGSGSKWRPRHHTERPSPQVVRAMRERAQERDPQTQRQQLQPGHFHYYATCHPGLEGVVAAELESANIGAANVHPGKGVAAAGGAAASCSSPLRFKNAWKRDSCTAQTQAVAKYQQAFVHTD
jgi:hypothetical protein